MAGTEELMARLSQLENSYNADKQAAREKQFFDTYGGRFSNNRGLGLAILNELDARGIDTSAADEAVQQILDQLRTECNEILELTKEANEAAFPLCTDPCHSALSSLYRLGKRLLLFHRGL